MNPRVPDKHTVVYVRGIGNAEDEDNIKELLYEGSLKPRVDATNVKVTMCVKDNGKPYALINCNTAVLASKVIQELDKKEINGKRMSVSFFHAQAPPDSIPYVIGDTDGYREFIKQLREKVYGGRKKENYIKYQEERVHEKPVLPAQQHGEQPKQWINIDIQFKDMKEEVISTTLVIRNDNLYIKGFKNRKQEWFELCEREEKGKEKLPGAGYMAEELVGWDYSYSGMMGLEDAKQVKRTLKDARLGKAFAERAVRRLSCYPENEFNDDYMPVRLGLAGLSVMICEAARMDLFLEHFVGSQNGSNSHGGAWDLGMGLKDDKKQFVFLWNWGNISAALLKRSHNPFTEWDSGCDVNSEEAIACVHLVLNTSYELTRYGGAKVEILEVLVNFPVREIKFIDEAQQNKHNIYTKKTHDSNNQGDNMMDRLELTVPGRCISGHNWFSMEVVTPASTGDVIKEFKRDCRKQAGGDATEFVVRKIDLNSGSHLHSSDKKVEVTYLVMSNAVKATMTMEVRLQDENSDLAQEENSGGETAQDAGKEEGGGSEIYTAHGKITAYIGEFEKYPILLFERSVDKPIILKSSKLTFPLGRPTVHVPRDKELLIDMSKLVTNPEVHKKPDKVRFRFGESRSDGIAGNDSAFPVDVGWDLPCKIELAAEFTIGVDNFNEFINTVRKVFADKKFELSKEALRKYRNAHEHGRHVGNQENLHDNLYLTRPRPTNGQPEKWKHIELRVEEGLSTTLAVQDGKCYGVGFMNRSQVWYDLGHGIEARNKTLPPKYHSVLLGWGLSYKDILNVRNWQQVPMMLKGEGLGSKGFAEKAVRTLSRYPDVDEDDLKPRVALAGLILMVCESARFNPLLEYFQNNWDKDKNNINTDAEGFSDKQMKYIRSWGNISRALLRWKRSGYKQWSIDDTNSMLKDVITNELDALRADHLVFNRDTPGSALPPEVLEL